MQNNHPNSRITHPLNYSSASSNSGPSHPRRSAWPALLFGAACLVVGVTLGLLLPQISPDAILQFATNPLVRLGATILANLGVIAVTLLANDIALGFTGNPTKRVPSSTRSKVIFSVGALFLVAGTALTTNLPASGTNRATFLYDIGTRDDDQFTPGQVFSKGWRFYNGGDTTWQHYEVRQFSVAGPGPVGPKGFVVPDTTPKTDTTVNITSITAPQAPGCYRTMYRLYPASAAAPFGDAMWVQIVVGPPGPKIDYMLFIDDGNIHGGTAMSPGQAFDKIWLIHNCGDNAWAKYHALRLSGTIGPLDVAVPTLSSHQDVILHADMTAPFTPGTYESAYQIFNTAQQPVGLPFMVNIAVK